MTDHAGIGSAPPGSTWLRFERRPFIPELKSSGLSGQFVKSSGWNQKQWMIALFAPLLTAP
jgi:hypothetical protein